MALMAPWRNKPLEKGMSVLKPCFWGREDIVALKHRLEGRVGAPKALAPAAAPPALEAKAGQEGFVAASEAVAGPQTSDAVEKDLDSFEVAVVRDDEEAGGDDLPRCRPFPSSDLAGQRCGRRQGQRPAARANICPDPALLRVMSRVLLCLLLCQGIAKSRAAGIPIGC